jgi:hypothetical protein
LGISADLVYAMKERGLLCFLASILVIISLSQAEIGHFPDVHIIDVDVGGLKQSKSTKVADNTKELSSSGAILRKSDQKAAGTVNSKLDLNLLDLMDFDLSSPKKQQADPQLFDVSVRNIVTLTETAAPTEYPTFVPTQIPTLPPTDVPTPFPTSSSPTVAPTVAPTFSPSNSPTISPSAQPTPLPTFFPTASPTTAAPISPGAVATVIQASQTLVGVTSSTWNQDPETNCHVFAQTVQKVTANAVLASEVGNCVATDNRRLLQEMLLSMERRRLQTTASSTIGYDITLPVSTDVTATTTLATTITSTISAAVSSGNFTTTLRSVAVANNATTLSNVNTTGFASTVVITTGPSSPKSVKLTKGQIAGIVIGALIGTAAVVGLVYYFITLRRSKAGFSESHDESGPSEGLAVISRDVEGEAGNESFMLADDKNDASYIDSDPSENKPEAGSTSPMQTEEMQVVIQSGVETRL